MAERELVSLLEKEAGLETARNVVITLYKGDLREIAIRTSPTAMIEKAGQDLPKSTLIEFPAEDILPLEAIQERQILWKNLAKNYPPYTEKMLELQQAVENAYAIYGQNRNLIAQTIVHHFAGVEDPLAIGLLSDILVARGTRAEEAHTMWDEIGMYTQEERSYLSMSNLTEYILLGTLSLKNPIYEPYGNRTKNSTP